MHLPVKHGFSMHIRGNSLNNTFGEVRTKKDKQGKIVPKLHQGWDIASFPGSPVYAITDGIIEFVKDYGTVGYGKHLCLKFEHKGETLYALYAHLQSIDIAAGQPVTEGQQLGRSGQTGNAENQHHTEAHLHFEIREKPNSGLLSDLRDPMTVLGFSPIAEIVFADMPKLPDIPK